MEYSQYIERLKKFSTEHEDACARCGACCGAFDGDPCVNLTKLEDGGYYCAVYRYRFGHQRTVSGALFMCVPIRDRIQTGNLPQHCAYGKKSSMFMEQRERKQ